MRYSIPRRIRGEVYKVLDPTAEYKVWKSALEKIEEEKKFKVSKKAAIFTTLGLFVVVGVSALSIGIGRGIFYLGRLGVSPSAYWQFKEEGRERRISQIIEYAKISEKKDTELSREDLHKKYIFMLDDYQNVVPRMPEDYKTVVLLFGAPVGRSIMAWSNYFNVDPGIVVAILCAENGSSLDQNILNTVSSKFKENPQFADQTVSKSDARGIAQIKPLTAKLMIQKLAKEGRWPFQTIDVNKVLSNYDMSIFLLCALIQEIQQSGYSDIKNIAGIYHSGHNGWSRKKAGEENNDEVWKHIKKAERAVEQYNSLKQYINENK